MKKLHLPVSGSNLPIVNALSKDDFLEQLATLTTGYTPDPASEQQEATYYDYPVLKAPFWRWEIIWYFFFGGLAAGCYVLATIASLFGSPEDRSVTRTGYYLSLLALLPCPALLIKDLGRPERFLHMLRVFKVKSPMSMESHNWRLNPLLALRGRQFVKLQIALPMSTGVRIWRLSPFVHILSLLSAILCLTLDKTGSRTMLYTRQY